MPKSPPLHPAGLGMRSEVARADATLAEDFTHLPRGPSGRSPRDHTGGGGCLIFIFFRGKQFQNFDCPKKVASDPLSGGDCLVIEGPKCCTNFRPFHPHLFDQTPPHAAAAPSLESVVVSSVIADKSPLRRRGVCEYAWPPKYFFARLKEKCRWVRVLFLLRI